MRDRLSAVLRPVRAERVLWDEPKERDVSPTIHGCAGVRRLATALLASGLLWAIGWTAAVVPGLVRPTDAGAPGPTAALYLMLGPADFVPGDGGQAYAMNPADLSPRTTSRQDFYAPVHLPNGATLVRLRSRWADREDGRDLRVRLYESSFPEDPSGLVFQTIASAESSLSPGFGTTEVPISTRPVDNAAKRYTVELTFPDGPGTRVALHSVRIEYTVPTVWLPLILRS
jgi:hypothetical protein